MQFSEEVEKVTRKEFLPKMADTVLNPGVFNKMMYKKQFIEDVEEYHTLTNRHWKRKRELEKHIVFAAIYWLEDIKKIQEQNSKLTIKFKKRNG